MKNALTIHRKSYKRKPYDRKPYVRSDGTHVKGAHVPASTVPAVTFTAPDRGAPGRTPKSDRFYHPKVKTGWSKRLSTEVRRRRVLKAHKGDYLASARGMQALANVTTDPVTKQLATSDARYFYQAHRRTGR